MRYAMIFLVCILACAILVSGCQLVDRLLEPAAQHAKAYAEAPPPPPPAGGVGSIVYWIMGLGASVLVLVHEGRKAIRKDLKGGKPSLLRLG